jgi:hypothetical protein
MYRIFVFVCSLLIVMVTFGFGLVQYLQAKHAARAEQVAAESMRAVALGIEAERRTQVQTDERGKAGDQSELAPFHFLIGTWRGEMGGGLVEEIWSKPEGNALMGMFRWLNPDGRSRMYEMLTISREDDETYLRLRHFSAAMVAWEEKDAPVVLKLTESAPGRALFVNVTETDRMERIVFHQSEPGKLAIDVEFREDSGRAPLNFRFLAAE